MALWEKFGEFDSAEEINRAAEGLKEEGDTKSITALAKENGLDPDDAKDYIDGYIEFLASPLSAADGKIRMEMKELKLPEDILISDWCRYIVAQAVKDEKMCLAIRRKDKKLAECIGQIMKEAFSNQWNVPEDIKKGAGVNTGRVTFGVPAADKVNEIIKDYYLGGKS